MIFADIQINRYQLHTTREKQLKYEIERNYEHTVFAVSGGKVQAYSLFQNKVINLEYMYIHTQGRKLDVGDNLDVLDYLIAPPNKAIKKEILTAETLKKLTKNKWWTWNVPGQIKEILFNIKKRMLQV